MPVLVSGTYQEKREKRVVVWPSPDKDGDGPEVWESETDPQGIEYGTTQAKDKHGNLLHFYLPPEGFRNIPSSDNADCYVMVTERGTVVRQGNGEAIQIRPGEALVLSPVNDVLERLTGERAMYEWAKLHDAVEKKVAPKGKGQ